MSRVPVCQSVCVCPSAQLLLQVCQPSHLLSATITASILNTGGFFLFHATFGETLNANLPLLCAFLWDHITLFTKLNCPDAE